MLRVLDLFSGIGGFSLGLERTGGFKTVAFCEIDPFCRRVLAHHWPDVPILGDVSTAEFPDADVVVGGFPCQDVSQAGKRAGVSGTRSGLYRQLVRALRLVRPRHAIMENVAALLGDGMGDVLGDVAESGFDAEWDCVPACAVGAPHERDRVWIVAHANDGHGDPNEALCAGRHAVGLCAEIGTAADAAHAYGAWRLQSEGRQPDERGWLGDRASSRPLADALGVGCGQGRTRRPPDSFARIRDEARRNAADSLEGRCAFRNGYSRSAWDVLSAAEREAIGAGARQIWPNEPALSGVDDGVSNRVDRDWKHRIAATGNALLPQIPELIGRAILAANHTTDAARVPMEGR